MYSFVIEGGRPLNGEITVAGNKNAALPMLAATLLSDEVVHLDNVPDIQDVRTMRAALEDLGVERHAKGPGGSLPRQEPARRPAPRRRSAGACGPASCWRARCWRAPGRAELPAPGGDKHRPAAAGHPHQGVPRAGRRGGGAARPLFMQRAARPDRRDIFLDEMSVMATENVVMAAALARGTTVIRNAAREPHVQDLCRMLVAMGARIEGIGSNTLQIAGRGSAARGDRGAWAPTTSRSAASSPWRRSPAASC